MAFSDDTGQFVANMPTTQVSYQVAFDEANMMVYTVVGPFGVFPLPGSNDSQ
jgi:hypothetical protein